ncbi:P1 family peptidase [Rouxiella chamberiensis]|uniref:P1 family peptidase n=2 Tax=Rouxiella chamberiensis TaxID=1513468 RepID=A0ABY7HUM3_9GAMM|nr:P1 family peptidase [Rouxiella chamberiensis]WAT02652.1 P1 family peptidase [Rouxiella chamberiensis]
MNMTDFTRQGVRALLTRWQQQRQIFTPRFAMGATNSLGDVAGIKVGHSTLDEGEIQTGVTAIVPPGDALYTHPLPCGAAVLNGFAKPVGLVQVMELGELQTPILLGNTFAVGTLFNAMVRKSCMDFPQIGRGSATINPLVLECNDAFLNDIQAMAISESHAHDALTAAAPQFARGSVGAGRGMSCFGLKGGVGTASRVDEKRGITLGVLVLANFGVLSELTLDGVRIGGEIESLLPELAPQVDAGSIIIIMACDAYLDSRQLTRIARRAGAGLGRLGSYWGHGSGDIAVAFSTRREEPRLPDDELESLLAMAADSTEHAVLDAMLTAETVVGFQQHYRLGLSSVLDELSARQPFDTSLENSK